MAVPMTGANGFNPYAAGVKRYGVNASSAATTGPVDKRGYQEREQRNKLKQQIYLRWMQENSAGSAGSANALRRG